MAKDITTRNTNPNLKGTTMNMNMNNDDAETMNNDQTPQHTQILHEATGMGVSGPGGIYKPDAKAVTTPNERCERCGAPGMWIAGAGEVLCVRHQDSY